MDAAFVFQTKVGIDKSDGRRSHEPSAEQWLGRKCVASEALLFGESPPCLANLHRVGGESNNEMHLYFESRPVPFLEKYN
jgi:hypothetical protein